MERERTNEELRLAVAEWINRKMVKRDLPALTWALQRIIFAMISLHPPEIARQEVLHAVTEIVGRQGR